MTYSDITEAIEALAAEIGENIYLDIAKWHLYLSNAHLHTGLAEQLYPLLVDGEIEESQVSTILRNIPVKIGGGRQELSLMDFLPQQGLTNLMELLSDYQQQI